MDKRGLSSRRHVQTARRARTSPAKTRVAKAVRSRRPTNKRNQVQRSEPQNPETYATLEGLLDNLGPGVVQVLAAPRGLGVGVRDAVIHDPVEPSVIEPGDVVLAVAPGTEGNDASTLIRHSASCGAAAVAVKSRAVTDNLAGLADSAGVALLEVPPEMAWGQLYTLMRTAIASIGVLSGGEPRSVPVGDLFALANAVAGMVGGPVTIEDPQCRVLAYSSLGDPVDEARREAILGRRVSESWMRRLHAEGVFKRLWSSDNAIRIDLPIKGYNRRLAIAVRAGGEILGSIWVAEGRDPLGAEAEAALGEAARIAALHLIRHRRGEDLERGMRGDLLESLLDGRGSAEHLASRLGIQAKSSFTVVAFELQLTDEIEIAVRRERALSLVSGYCEAFRRPATCVAIGRTIYALLPSGPQQRKALVRLMEGAVRQAREILKVPLHAGIGSTVAHLREAPRSRSEADQVLRVLAEDLGGAAVGDIEEVGAHTLLLELKDLAADRPHVLSGKLRRLREHDAEHGTSYVETLRAYLNAFGDTRTAAATMGLHPNTFRYRTRRLVEISGLDLSDPNQRLATELALRTQ